MGKPLILRQRRDRLVIEAATRVGTGGGGTGGSGFIIIADASPSGGGTVTDKVFQNPGDDTVLRSFTSSDGLVDVLVRASYPEVAVGSFSSTLAPAADSGHYEGTVSVTLAVDGELTATVTTPDGEDGATASVDVTLDLPPIISSAEFVGGYPGAQTELKQGDSFDLTVIADKDFDEVVLEDFGVSAGESIATATGQSATVTITIADRGDVLQQLPARVRVRDAVTGALSTAYDTDVAGSVDGLNVLSLNDLRPTVAWSTLTYPASQSAIKSSEQATVGVSLADFDAVVFDSNGSGELSVNNPTLAEATKTVTRIGGTYNVLTPNLRAQATRDANASTTTDTVVVAIANVAAQITVSPPAARLVSGGADGTSPVDHAITLSSDQQLSSVALDEELGGGTFLGSWVGGPVFFSRDLRVDDADTKGTYTWRNLLATNRSGIQTTTVTSGASYTLGGFVARTLTFAAFSQSTTIGTPVVDYAKLTAGIFTATNQPAVKRPTQGDTSDVANGYTITTPTSLFWNDVAAAGSNSSGTAAIADLEETP